MSGVGPDLTGQVFGRFTILGLHTERSKHGAKLWECVCICGNTKYHPTAILRSGKVVSCGCHRNERAVENIKKATHHGKANYKHGGGGTPEYGAWTEMRKRCLCSTGHAYADYGGRGISICERWLVSFANFLEDMGKKPTPSHSLDRIDNNGNYCPENCRWATKKEQARNRRSNHFVTAHGQTHTIAEWAELVGMHEVSLRDRIIRMPAELAIPVPTQDQ